MGLRKFKKTDVFDSIDMPARLEPAALALALQSSDAAHRRHSMWCAWPCPETTALLLQHLQVETDVDAQEALLVALSQSEGEAVVPALLEQLSSEDVLLRNRALEVLAGFVPQVALQMPQALQTTDVDKRIFLVNLMGELRHPLAPEWVEDILQKEPHVNVVAAALDVAAEVGDQHMLAAIDGAAQRFIEDAFIGFAADIARQRIGVQ